MFRKKQSVHKGTDEIFNIPPYLIKPNPALSRTEFQDTTLCSLADSIRRYGILQPLAVRLSENGRYELIAGERRLRAAVLLKMPTVPCVLLEDCDNFEYLSVVENLQRESLGMFDEARAIKRLYLRSGKSLSKTASLLSLGETDIIRKLRLTELSRAEMQAVTRLGICESTVIQLLEIPSSVRFYAIKISAERCFGEEKIIKLCEALEGITLPTQQDLERAVEFILKGEDREASCEKNGEEIEAHSHSSTKAAIERKSKVLLRDLRIFENSLKRSLEILESAGYEVSLESCISEGERTYTVSLKRRES